MWNTIDFFQSKSFFLFKYLSSTIVIWQPLRSEQDWLYISEDDNVICGRDCTIHSKHIIFKVSLPVLLSVSTSFTMLGNNIFNSGKTKWFIYNVQTMYTNILFKLKYDKNVSIKKTVILNKIILWRHFG